MTLPTVLIVEDNAITRKLCRVTLSAEGFSVLEAPDARSALEVVARAVPDLVLQDLLLPDMDGFELVRAIRAHPNGTDVPIVAFSGFLSRAESARVLTAGFTDFLVKPLEPSRLVQMVQTYLGSQTGQSDLPGLGRRVLVVDDDPVGLKLAQVHLKQAGFEVDGATDGLDALRRARELMPDAVLSDVLMPRFDGFQLCLAIREDPRLRHLPVVLCSANYVEPADQCLADRVGASALVARSPDIGEALRVLLESLRTGRAPTPEGHPELVEGERLHRVVRQLERQVAMNSGLVQRVSLQAAILSLVASLPGSAATSVDIEAAPLEALTSILDAGGVSAGAVYLLDPDGGLRLQTQSGFSAAGAAEAADFFGHRDLFDLALREQRGIAVPSADVTGELARDFLTRADVGVLVIAPLTSRDDRLGALVLGSQRRDLTHSDWLAFARSIGSQLAHTMALSRAFARLAASERRYRSLFDNMPLGLFRTTPDGRFLDANPAFADMQGYADRGALVASRASEVYEDSEDRRRLLDLLDREEMVRGFEARMRRRDGRLLWGRINIRRVREEQGDVVYEGSLEDITERRHAEQRLAAEHAVTWALADSSTLEEAAPRILEALCTRLELSLGELWQVDVAAGVLRPVAVWHQPTRPGQEFARQTRQMTFEQGVGLPGRVWATRGPVWIPDFAEDGTLPRAALARGAGVRAAFGLPLALGDDVLGVIAFYSDEVREPDMNLIGTLANVGSQIGQCLERWRAEAELERQRESLIQTEKLAAMGQLLAGVAHELNNPLSVVLGQAALLAGGVAGGPHAERVKKIAAAADRCARIVKNFLALARQRPPERRRVSVNDVVREAVELLAYPLRVDNVEVVLDLSANVPPLRADPHQLHQVIVNLVTNAHHAMRQMAGPRRLTLASRLALGSGHVVVSVADTGPGIPPAIRARIFEPFFTTKPPGEGTGLGLSLCRGIVETHGGILSVEMPAEGGTLFRIELPVEAASPPAAPAVDLLPLPVAGKRILVVDDEQEVAGLLAEMLAADGHEVDTVGNGRLALERLAQRRYDLVLSDLQMPELDGPGLYGEVEARHPELGRRFVFVTGDTFGAAARALLDRAGLPSVSKPFELDEILRVVRQVLGQGGAT